MKSIIVHYQEIALKGNNRPWFISRLVQNLRVATSDLDVLKVRALMGRIEIVLGMKVSWEEVATRVRRVLGIANFSLSGRGSLELDDLARAILRDLGDRAPLSFRVSVRRADKRLPLTSPEMEREVGGRIQEAKGWTVNLSKPELTIHVEALATEAFYYFGKEKGPGGLPTGVSGRVTCLLSGGIDSPVAAYRMMKRGCLVQFVHFHSHPILSNVSQEKVREISRLLTRHQLNSQLHLVSFGELQRRVVVSVPPPIRIVIYRRLMMRIAEKLARAWRAQALVTGEAVGQVASQTLENLAIIDTVTTFPVFRPLIGMDKAEITTEAEQLGTFPVSIVPDEDCCQLFTPKHPATKAKRVDVEAAERTFPLEELVAAAVASAVVEEFHFPVQRTAATL